MKLHIGDCYDKNGKLMTEEKNIEYAPLAEYLSDILHKRQENKNKTCAVSASDKNTAAWYHKMLLQLLLYYGIITAMDIDRVHLP